MQREAIKIKPNETDHPSRLRVTTAEISEVKRAFILRNLVLTLEDAGAIFGKSWQWARERLKDGSFIGADEFARKGKNGELQASQGIRVTAESVESYRESILIDPQLWKE